MGRLLPALAGLVFGATMATAGEPATLRDQDPIAVTVVVYNDAGIPVTLLDGASKVLARIFAHAGVGVTWAVNDGRTRLAGSSEKPDVVKSFCLVRIVTAPGPGARAASLGFTPHGTRVTSVVYPRVEALALSAGAETSVLLGHVIAHELGHLLLGRTAHSATGLMRSTLDVPLAAQAQLFFSEADGRAVAGGARRLQVPSPNVGGTARPDSVGRK